ncbi:amidohydrolase [Solitalea longa]|uniref:Amidohydrolase n=1 Tax=Solitalea longa TaxID=2079460 RepID=A0A2S5A0T6_9SPHI|nr:amidohydrolase family protein [Solitalea longa]POY35743.1 amidohydrolase [Solitalea longa]
MAIDAHVHFWKFDPVRDSWIDGTMQVIRRDFYPADLAPVFTENGISGCIAVQADQSEAETEFLLSLAHEHSFIKGIVGWIDFKHDNIAKRLAHYSSTKLIKGWRHIAQAEPSGFLINERFLNGLSLLKQYNYTYDILIQHKQLTDAIKLVDRLPEQAFIIDHCAKPNIKNNELEEWKKHLKVLAQNPNVYCKLSGLMTEAQWNNWTPEQVVKYIDAVFNTFDINRIVFASDWPVMLLAGNYPQWKKLIEKYMAQFNAEERDLVFSQNATRFYNLYKDR